MKYVSSKAVFSDCGNYRYRLERIWSKKPRPKLRLVCWVMLNPSTADADEDDPTIRRCVGFAHRWGYDGIIVVNVFGLRTSFPEVLVAARKLGVDPAGRQNNVTIGHAVRDAELVICAWGTNAGHRGVLLLRQLRYMCTPKHLGLNEDGSPKHPLYLPGGTIPEIFPRNSKYALRSAGVGEKPQR